MTGAYAYTPGNWPPLAAAAFVAVLGLYGWQRRNAPAVKPFVAIVDDGQGFDPATGGGYGQGFGSQAMRERPEGLGRGLAMISAPGQGTQVLVTLSAQRVRLGGGTEDPPVGRP